MFKKDFSLQSDSISSSDWMQSKKSFRMAENEQIENWKQQIKEFK